MPALELQKEGNRIAAWPRRTPDGSDVTCGRSRPFKVRHTCATREVRTEFGMNLSAGSHRSCRRRHTGSRTRHKHQQLLVAQSVLAVGSIFEDPQVHTSFAAWTTDGTCASGAAWFPTVRCRHGRVCGFVEGLPGICASPLRLWVTALTGTRSPPSPGRLVRGTPCLLGPLPPSSLAPSVSPAARFPCCHRPRATTCHLLLCTICEPLQPASLPHPVLPATYHIPSPCTTRQARQSPITQQHRPLPPTNHRPILPLAHFTSLPHFSPFYTSRHQLLHPLSLRPSCLLQVPRLPEHTSAVQDIAALPTQAASS